MAGYQTPEDIANRALQHCRADTIATFSDQSQGAVETKFVYDKVREAELRRRVWKFAVRRSILRSLDITSMLWTPPAYAAGTTYAAGNIVTYGNDWWQSKVGSNVAHTPDAGAYWARYFGPDTLEAYAAGTTYHAGDLAKTGGVVYLCLTEGTIADIPPSANWLAVNGTTLVLDILYPISTGPRTDQQTNNVFRLPRGFLRRAPTDPKGGMRQVVGTPVGPGVEDWQIEGDYIISADPGPLMIRFVANITDVPDFDPMFCEALAARIATEIAPRVADDKYLNVAISNAARHYRSEISEAGIINGIETGSLSSQLDDWITVRY